MFLKWFFAKKDNTFCIAWRPKHIKTNNQFSERFEIRTWPRNHFSMRNLGYLWMFRRILERVEIAIDINSAPLLRPSLFSCYNTLIHIMLVYGNKVVKEYVCDRLGATTINPTNLYMATCMCGATCLAFTNANSYVFHAFEADKKAKLFLNL